MELKAIEIRDVATFIPAITIKMVPSSETQCYLLRRAGYGFDHPLIMLLCMGGGQANYDPYNWSSPTYHEVHKWLTEHFDEIEDGAVVDVEYITGRSVSPRLSERFEA